MGTAIEFLTTAMSLVQAGGDLVSTAESAYAAITQPGGPTQADWDALHASEAALRIQLAAAQAGDTA